LSVVVIIATLAGAVGAALLTRSRIGPITGTLEGLSASSSTVLAKLGQNLPVGYAVGAGMVAAVNPCGFPMLPAYLGLFVGTGATSERIPGIGRRVMRAIIVSLTMTAAFVLLFAGAGIALSRGLHAVTQAFPAIGLAVGVLMVLIGGWMVAGGTLYVDLGDRAADRFRGPARGAGIPAYFAYGIAYALVSLSCTLPIFLVIVGGAVRTRCRPAPTHPIRNGNGAGDHAPDRGHQPVASCGGPERPGRSAPRPAGECRIAAARRGLPRLLLADGRWNLEERHPMMISTIRAT
jgi:cytochrome c biogenesis protein CcdA